MKVLILANKDVGLYKFRKELLMYLVEKYEVCVCVPDGSYIPHIKQIGCKVIDCRLLERHGTNPIKDFKLIMYYNKLIKEYNPNVVLTYTIKPNIYGGMSCCLRKIPYIANITGLGTALENKGVIQKITKLLYKLGLSRANCVFFQNQSNYDFMISKKIVDKKTARLLPGSGVNTKEYSYEEYPKNSENIIFSTIGRIMKDKGTSEIVAAAEIIKKENSNVIFRLIGDFDDDYEDIISKKINQGIIEYIPFQDNVKDYMKESHAIIHASYHEGMSNVLLEASAIGRPVIATNIPGCREIFDTGMTGIAFEPRDVDGLVSVIKQFLKLNYQEKEMMGKKARDKVLNEFDRNIVISRYTEEIEKITEGKNV